MELTQERLKERVHYNQENGIFTNKVRRKGTRGIGDRAGSLHTSGYRHITIDYILYLEHRLAWFYVYGEWPKDQIDHINNIRDDNRLCNLREATNSENQFNRKNISGFSSKYKGVSFHSRDQKWVACIGSNYKVIYLGRFDDEEEAALAYDEKAKELFGEYAYLNFSEEMV